LAVGRADPPPPAAVRRPSDDASDAGQKRRILIVEDEALVAMQLSSLLEDADYEVVGCVASAPAAVKESRRLAPDLVVMDITLAGGGDGITAAEQIHRELGVRSMFVSANSDPTTLARARAVGFGYVRKPFAEWELLRTVSRALGG
jgi:CheY-like chemotaxis protein